MLSSRPMGSVSTTPATMAPAAEAQIKNDSDGGGAIAGETQTLSAAAPAPPATTNAASPLQV